MACFASAPFGTLVSCPFCSGTCTAWRARMRSLHTYPTLASALAAFTKSARAAIAQQASRLSYFPLLPYMPFLAWFPASMFHITAVQLSACQHSGPSIDFCRHHCFACCAACGCCRCGCRRRRRRGAAASRQAAARRRICTQAAQRRPAQRQPPVAGRPESCDGTAGVWWPQRGRGCGRSR